MFYRYEHYMSFSHIALIVAIVQLYHNSSVWQDTLDALNWVRKPPNYTLDR